MPQQTSTFDVCSWVPILQVVSNVVIYVCTNIIGIYFHYPMEAQQREAFIETRNCITVRLNTQKENEKQVSGEGVQMLMFTVRFDVLRVPFQ
ncbi:adenylate cyclase [Elysia marginata]|uniref:Adenylate cyclase n=1 Tax=Elysia marginata TaxID=1093978 RepID=A0AAV4EHL8_9GAST|nr:adenylate cyclase [Elysia marginata]